MLRVKESMKSCNFIKAINNHKVPEFFMDPITIPQKISKSFFVINNYSELHVVNFGFVGKISKTPLGF
jgi:hypothetical protein